MISVGGSLKLYLGRFEFDLLHRIFLLVMEAQRRIRSLLWTFYFRMKILFFVFFLLCSIFIFYFFLVKNYSNCFDLIITVVLEPYGEGSWLQNSRFESSNIKSCTWLLFLETLIKKFGEFISFSRGFYGKFLVLGNTGNSVNSSYLWLFWQYLCAKVFRAIWNLKVALT